jgi:hypothetical protein
MGGVAWWWLVVAAVALALSAWEREREGEKGADFFCILAFFEK